MRLSGTFASSLFDALVNQFGSLVMERHVKQPCQPDSRQREPLVYASGVAREWPVAF